MASQVAGAIFDQERGLSIVLPPADRIVDVTPDNVLHLSVLPDGAVEVKRGKSPQVQRTRAEEVARIWRAQVQDAPGLIAAVKTAPDAPHGAMVDVLDQLRAAGAARVNLDLLEPGGGR